MTIRIVLIDDHTLLRDGIKALLSTKPDFEIIGEAENGADGIQTVSRLQPDIVLLDLNMPVMNGRETLSHILNDNPLQKVVILTESEDSNDLTACMRLGACGYLLKNIHSDFLINSIRKVICGNNVFSPEMTSRLVQSLISPSSSTSERALATLTPRELEILGCLAAGHSNKIIARHLALAESTVKVHVQNILRKLCLASRVQAAVYAVQHKVPQPEWDE
ncbi:response regulator [Neisseria perflava]|uniref:response regulator n=1 Tax=Neisseria perflava TaxID=33053 RepID=UPI0020A18910|nr:response regulator transcription factor [Neisseria perflava]MCP1660606.1 two-component system nitrate/nitrite response regulator NarL [Neisseria perflava]MCP1772394.1 two-component system nitrate/nitrite response regulator NarL [Neisseria perflava]